MLHQLIRDDILDSRGRPLYFSERVYLVKKV